MAAVRRRGQNKHLDVEQVRRLDMEMAAAVNAMKTGEKEDRPGKSQIKLRGCANIKFVIINCNISIVCM